MCSRALNIEPRYDCTARLRGRLQRLAPRSCFLHSWQQRARHEKEGVGRVAREWLPSYSSLRSSDIENRLIHHLRRSSYEQYHTADPIALETPQALFAFPTCSQMTAHRVLFLRAETTASSSTSTMAIAATSSASRCPH